jgi:hypothetical protein
MHKIERLSYKEVANARLTARVRQMMVLLLTIVIGILISVSINA